MPPVLLVLLAIASVQIGSALAKGLFDEIGPGGTVFLRLLFAAVVLMAVWRPSLRGRSRRDLVLVVVFGLVLACMNMSFYAALDRIPLGAAVTFEFVGPLGVAVAGSRRPLDLLWVALAAAGILLLSDFGAGGLDGLGIALALLAGAFWAAYILLSARIGSRYEGADGLALAMVVGAVVLVPVGVGEAGGELAGPMDPRRRPRRGGALVGAPLRARDGGAAAHAHERLRRAHVARARHGGPRRLCGAG